MKKFFLCCSNNEPQLKDAAQELLAGRNRDDVIEASIHALERDSSDDSLGIGGYPDLYGRMSLDAAFMDGDTRNIGAVMGVSRFLPVKIARLLMEQNKAGRALHNLLFGEGAEIFAGQSGFAPEEILTGLQRAAWERDIKPMLDNRAPGETDMDIVRRIAFPGGPNLDTSIMIASDGEGISGGSSTAGWPYKHAGRSGDTAVPGAGLYVDSAYGGACCTYTGERAVRTGAARFIVARMAAGDTPEQAVRAAAQDVGRLQGGLPGALIIHAVNRNGEVFVGALDAEQPAGYQYWSEDLPVPVRRHATPLQTPQVA